MYEGGPAIMENSAIAHGVSHDLVTQKAIEFNRDSHIEPVVDNALESWRKIVTNDINNNSPGEFKVQPHLLINVAFVSRLSFYIQI